MNTKEPYFTRAEAAYWIAHVAVALAKQYGGVEFIQCAFAICFSLEIGTPLHELRHHLLKARRMTFDEGHKIMRGERLFALAVGQILRHTIDTGKYCEAAA